MHPETFSFPVFEHKRPLIELSESIEAQLPKLTNLYQFSSIFFLILAIPSLASKLIPLDQCNTTLRVISVKREKQEITPHKTKLLDLMA